VAEISDHDSPEEQPEMTLVTGDELQDITVSYFENATKRQISRRISCTATVGGNVKLQATAIGQFLQLAAGL
jgi:hypothetical protein